MINANFRRFWYWTPWGTGAGMNPNRSFPDDRGHFPGTPTAVRLDAPSPTPALTQRPPDVEPGGIISFRVLQDPFPQCCCNCLGPPDTTIAILPKRGHNPPLYMYICRKCHADHQKRKTRFLWKLLVLPAASLQALGTLFLLLAFLSGVMPLAESESSVLGFFVVGLFPSAFIGLIISGLIWIGKGEPLGFPTNGGHGGRTA